MNKGSWLSVSQPPNYIRYVLTKTETIVINPEYFNSIKVYNHIHKCNRRKVQGEKIKVYYFIERKKKNEKL